MSKRVMETQGGGERYGFGEEVGENPEKRMRATAAQLAKRNIAPLKRRPGTGSARSSRQPSPAVNFTQTQPFQPPAGANFSFEFGSNNESAPAFTFGTPQPETQQNGSGMFGSTNTPSFGGFSAQQQPQTQQQQQTNGFNPSTSTVFGQNNAAPAGQFTFGQSQPAPQTNGTSSTFGGFGQQNGTSSAASTNFSFGATGDKSKESTPSFTFGAQPEKPKESTPSFTFGTPAEKPKESTPGAFSFGASQQAQPANTQTPSFQFGASKPETTQATPAFSFGQFTQAGSSTPTTGLFGATPPPAQPAAASGDSVFSNLSKPNGIKTGMFTQSQQPDQTPKPKTPFSFTAQTEKKPVDPKPNGLFFTPQPEKTTEAPKPGSFAFGQTSSASTETPKPANSFFNFGQSTTPAPAAPVEQTPKPSAGFNGFGQSQTQSETPKPSNMFSAQATTFGTEDASMTTPTQTPQKPEVSQSAPTAQESRQSTSQSTGKSLFDRMTPGEAPATAPKPRLGGPLFTTDTSSEETPKASSKSLFDRMEAPATAPRPPTSFNGFGAPATATNSKTSASAATPTLSSLKPSSGGALQALSAEQSNRTPLGRDWAKLAKLNHNVLNHLRGRDPDADWSPVFYYYIQEAAKLLGKEGFKTPSGGTSLTTTSVSSTTTSKQSVEPPPSAAVGNFTTPKPQTVGNIFSKVAEPPATAPVNKKRAAEDDAAQPPATEKRVKPSESTHYPKLPESASNTARLFESTLSKPAETPKAKSGFNPSTTSLFSTQKPASGSTAQSSTGFKPSGFQPSGTATGDFLASFGKQAEESQQKERKKRKQEEYDSDEEDEASWEAKDKARREEKRRKIEEAAKGASGFVFKPSTTPSTSKSLFSFDGAQDDADKTQGEKSQGSGDNTWKPETPIKFGTSSTGQASTTPAAAPPANPFGGLFGASSTSQSNGTNTGKLAPPSVGFQFGALKGSSVDTSRATTPGVTTDGETSNAGEGEPSEEQNDPQAEDMTALLPEEVTGHEVLFETRMARAVKLESKRTNGEDADGTPRASMQAAWVEKGRGPLYVLKDKSSGKTRVLLKVPPLGRPALNHPLVNVEYKLAQGKDKVVQCTFVDHTGSSEERAGKPSTWTIQVKAASEARKLVEIFNNNRS